MRTESRRRKGFTLIETVTTVGIIAVMAAVVIPQVTRQFDSADPTRVLEDLKSIQTAIATFHVNLKSQFPGDLDDLANPIITNTTLATAVDSGVFGAAPSLYTNTEVSSWTGPYVDFAITEAVAGASHTTGFSGLIMDNFVCYNATSDTPGDNAGCASPAGTDRLFLAVRVSGLSTAAFETINDRIDGLADGTGDGSGAGQSQVVGNFRLKSNIAYFLSIPLN